MDGFVTRRRRRRRGCRRYSPRFRSLAVGNAHLALASKVVARFPSARALSPKHEVWIARTPEPTAASAVWRGDPDDGLLGAEPADGAGWGRRAGAGGGKRALDPEQLRPLDPHQRVCRWELRADVAPGAGRAPRLVRRPQPDL